MSNQEKLLKIKEDNKELLTRVRSTIIEDGVNLSDSVDEIFKVFETLDLNQKKYEAILQAKELIFKLINEITTASTKEEIFEIRKKLNFYINKIKNELNKRHIDKELIAYQEKISTIRNDIAKYVRFIKRIDNIKTIEELNSKYSTLSDEEIKEFKKLLKNEIAYNKRNLNPNVKPKKVETIRDNDVTSNEEIARTTNINHEQTSETTENVFSELEGSLEAFLTKRSNVYNTRYGIIKTYQYTKSLRKNALILVKNIPIYLKNKKKVKLLERDATIFYGGIDLISFIEYTRLNNSVRNALKNIFSKSYLDSKEWEYLNTCESCVSWLTDYCNKREALARQL